MPRAIQSGPRMSSNGRIEVPAVISRLITSSARKKSVSPHTTCRRPSRELERRHEQGAVDLSKVRLEPEIVALLLAEAVAVGAADG